MARRLQESRKVDLIELAEAVLECHSAGSVRSTPAEILRAKGIGLHCGEYPEKFDALLSYETARRRFHVHLNLRRIKGDPECPRARFSIAHELGHYFIDEHRHALVAGKSPHPSCCGLFDSNDSLEEQEADCFAANLLMPPRDFVEAARGMESPLQTILALHKQFGASLTATSLQFVQHVSDNAIVLRWEPDGTLAWTRPGKGYRERGYRATRFKQPDSLPADSATGRVLAGEATQADGVLTLAHVFTNVALAGDRNTLAREEALSLGVYGTLTIISDHAETSEVSERAKRRRLRNSGKDQMS